MSALIERLHKAASGRIEYCASTPVRGQGGKKIVDDNPRHLTTDEERERFAVARDRGGLCTGCSRALGNDEAVYIEPIAIERKQFTAPGSQWAYKTGYRDAPLGEECASAAFLARMAGQEPERCAGCARPVYYAKERVGRQWPSCSKRCASRASQAARGTE